MIMSWDYVLSLVMICQRAAEKLPYFLFDSFVVEFDWLLQPNGFEYEKSVQCFLSSICVKFRDDWTTFAIGDGF